jgi:hypothetical protein
VLSAEEAAVWGGLRSALSGGQQFGEEAQDRVVLEEVALAQPDRRRLAQKCAALQRGGMAEQGMTLHSNCEQGCEREESRASFSGSSSARIRPMSCGAATTAASSGCSAVHAVWHGGRYDRDAVSRVRDR